MSLFDKQDEKARSKVRAIDFVNKHDSALSRGMSSDAERAIYSHLSKIKNRDKFNTRAEAILVEIKKNYKYFDDAKYQSYVSWLAQQVFK